ncbi:MAG: hypothetical protein IJB62_04150 [Alistipes sp.]|nr:hypothetical protein [Alistipes sp.]
MDSYLGNEQLLDRTLVAFFASRETPDDVAHKAIRWAEMICQTDKVVISGFNSPLEKEVLNTLLENKHPVILALGRSVYKRVPTQFVQPLAEGRMLIVSISNAVRQSWWTAQYRIFTVANWADECVWAGVHRGSLLDVPFDIYLSKSKKIEDFSL